MLYNVFMVASSTSIGDERGRASSKSSCRAICKGQHGDGVGLCLLFGVCSMLYVCSFLLTDRQSVSARSRRGVE